jgi:phosphoglycolate phosphatase-like HAD superfamily hydrolase
MADFAVIFDVDGVLLELTRAEEDAFFLPFERRYGLAGLSRDWDSYAIRNDVNIVEEILSCHGLALCDRDAVLGDYIEVLGRGIHNGSLSPVIVPGARQLLESLAAEAVLGIATANMVVAARLRLEATGLWNAVCRHPFGADGGGHKRDIVARAIAATGLPKHRIVYVGDNRNDVEAGLANGVHFIGFNRDAGRRKRLAAAGAPLTSADHRETLHLIRHILAS